MKTVKLNITIEFKTDADLDDEGVVKEDAIAHMQDLIDSGTLFEEALDFGFDTEEEDEDEDF